MGITREQAFPSKWLKAVDVPPTGVDVTIEKVEQEEVDYGDGAKQAVNVTFAEMPKPLGLNATNWDSIESLHGKDTDLWIGQKVRLYSTKTRNPSGATVPCVRIMPATTGTAAEGPFVEGPKAVWGKFYLTLTEDQKVNVKAILGGSPASWMHKAGKDINACIAFVKTAFKMGAAPVDAPPPDDIPFE
jgi:hypothetical protein